MSHHHAQYNSNIHHLPLRRLAFAMPLAARLGFFVKTYGLELTVQQNQIMSHTAMIAALMLLSSSHRGTVQMGRHQGPPFPTPL